jgi:hypothetical protein
MTSYVISSQKATVILFIIQFFSKPCCNKVVYNTIMWDRYFYSKSIRGAGEEFKNWALDQDESRRFSD